MNIGVQTDGSSRLTVISRRLRQCARLRQTGTTFLGWFIHVQVSDLASIVTVRRVRKRACASPDTLVGTAPEAEMVAQ
jgi:hypothetical protein